MLFHFSSCARTSEENIAAATKAATETTRRLDIAEPPRALILLLELFSVDLDAASDLADGLLVLRRRDVEAHFIAGLERILAPASAGLGDGIPRFEHPVLDVAAVVLGIHLHQHMRIRPHIFRDRSLHRHRSPRVKGSSPMVGQQRNSEFETDHRYDGAEPVCHEILQSVWPMVFRFSSPTALNRRCNQRGCGGPANRSAGTVTFGSTSVN